MTNLPFFCHMRMFHDIYQVSFPGKCKKSRQLRTVSHQRKSWCDEKGQEQKRQQKGVICYERMLWFCGLKKRLITRTTNGFFRLLPKNIRGFLKEYLLSKKTKLIFSISLRNSFLVTNFLFKCIENFALPLYSDTVSFITKKETNVLFALKIDSSMKIINHSNCLPKTFFTHFPDYCLCRGFYY